MPDPATAISLWDSIKAMVGAILAFFGWHYRQQNKRIGDLEKNAVTTEVHNQTIQAIRNDFREHAERVEQGITRTHERIDKILEHQAHGKNNGNG